MWKQCGKCYNKKKPKDYVVGTGKMHSVREFAKLAFDYLNLDYKKFVKIDLDPRLLHLLLQGPKFANWNNCEVGSHLKFQRNPDSYESAIYYCLNFFHV